MAIVKMLRKDSLRWVCRWFPSYVLVMDSLWESLYIKILERLFLNISSTRHKATVLSIFKKVGVFLYHSFATSKK